MLCSVSLGVGGPHILGTVQPWTHATGIRIYPGNLSSVGNELSGWIQIPTSGFWRFSQDKNA
jgi:hypothetical protein